jgi:tRNA-specific 2-thiouridylase
MPETARDRSRRIVVALSGGVDSSLAAALLVEAGHEPIGVTMHLAGSRSRCCSLEDADDARRVAERLGIRFYVANYTEAFREEVVEAFADAYLAGRTPIPCVTCNKRFKFDLLMERARVFGADLVATGHYARVVHDPGRNEWELRRPKDRAKDQTYFLFQLDQDQLARIVFPLGDLTKEQVRARARRLDIETADKPESQEICFVPDGDYAAVVEQVRPEAASRTGEIVDTQGQVLGRHGGVHHFTVGQRQGLGIAVGRRLYVTRIEAEAGRVVVGDLPDLEAKAMVIAHPHWISPSERPARVRVQVRYRHEPVRASVVDTSERRLALAFDEPVRAVSPGQAAVLYDEAEGERVLGGGWIERARC